MTPQTPIRGMDEETARRSLGPAINKMVETRDRLPKTIEAASRMDTKSLTTVTNEALVAAYNVQLLVKQIVETTDDASIRLLEV